MHDRSGRTVAINGVLVDLAEETLRDASGEAIVLRPQAFAVLRHLATHPNRLVTKGELMSAVWPGTWVTDGSLVQCVHEIRHALGDADHTVLKAMPKRGYQLVIPTKRASGRARRIIRGWPIAASFMPLLLFLTANAWWPAPVDSASAAPSVAVMPFDDLNGGDRQARFAAAFSEDLIVELSRASSLKVIARSSVETLEEEAPDLRQVARDLDVRYVLEGSLELQPTRIRVTAQLVDASTGALLWTERYDRPSDDLFAVRDVILTRLVGTLTGYDGPLWTEWIAAAKRRPPHSLQAFDYHLLAMEPYRRHDREGIREARRLLEKAVTLDPQLARAWDFLGHTYLQDAINGWGDDRARSWQLYRDATRRAAELDPMDGAIQMSLGTMHFERGEIALGEQAWERALALAPNDALVNRAMGTNMAIVFGSERATEATALVERALYELDPLHPPFQWFSMGYPLYFGGRYAEAVAAFRRVPDPWLDVRVMLALALAQAGLVDEAWGQAAKVLDEDPRFSAEAWIANDIYQPGSSSVLLFVEGADKAGLPICAESAESAAIAPEDRLPECEAERAGS